MMSIAIRGPLVLAALCALVIAVAFKLLGHAPGTTPYLLVAFFALLSIAGRLLQHQTQDPKQAVQSSMTVMALKMLASLLVLVVVVFATPRDRVLAMTLSFGGLYLIFLVYDTMHQFRSINRQQP